MTLLALVIAAGVAVISYFQWRTAHLRYILDLFEKRLSVYEALRDAIGGYLATGNVSDETLIAYMRARNQARFLFGNEVSTYLEQTFGDLAQAHVGPTLARTPEQIERDLAGINRLGEFHKKLEQLFLPYMKLDQKLPRTFPEVLEEFIGHLAPRVAEKKGSKQETVSKPTLVGGRAGAHVDPGTPDPIAGLK